METSKVEKLVKETNEKIKRTVSFETQVPEEKRISNLKNKTSFDYDGYHLDLTYITDNIIAMRFPHESQLQELQKFFFERHSNKIKVYSLCSEDSYNDNLFYQQTIYPFNDHEIPPFNLILPFCKDVDDWLKLDCENVAVIHCKAGVGRTGLMICAYLLYSGYVTTADESKEFFSLMRTRNGIALKNPSQVRYLRYFQRFIDEKMEYPIGDYSKHIQKVEVKNCQYELNTNVVLRCESNYRYTIQQFIGFPPSEVTANSFIFDFSLSPVTVTGDVMIALYQNCDNNSRDRLLYTFFHCFFEAGVKEIYLQKNSMEMLYKDTNHKHTPPNVEMTIIFNDLENL